MADGPPVPVSTKINMVPDPQSAAKASAALPVATIPAPSLLGTPGPWNVIKQAYKDWFGKDVQETPTVSYVWTADQFGHFGLGFTVTYLLGWTVGPYINQCIRNNIYSSFDPRFDLSTCALLTMTIWVIKEIQDFFRERKNFRNAHEVVGVADFPFNAAEIWWNVATALFYFLIGAAVAAASGYRPLWAAWVAAGFFFLNLPLAFWWLRRKITFQQAGLPYLYRLGNFPNRIDLVPRSEDTRDVIKLIEQFIAPKVSRDLVARKHLIISGPGNGGKTSLATGIGTEFAFRQGIGRFITMVELLQMAEPTRRLHSAAAPTVQRGGQLTVPEDQEFDDGRVLWQWDRVSMLLVDDVDNIERGLVRVGQTAEELRRGVAELTKQLGHTYPEVIAKLSAIPRVVWVLSNRFDASAMRDVLIQLCRIDASSVAIVEVSIIPRAPAEPGFWLRMLRRFFPGKANR